MNEMGLMTLDPDKIRADMFFGHTPPSTDWAAHIADIEGLDGAGIEKSVADAVIALSNYEPVDIASPHEHDIFVLQQRLRLMLRRKNGLPLVSDETCGLCGCHKVDPVLRNWQAGMCLYCAEHQEVIDYALFGSRGSCWYFKPKYDPATTAWGMLLYDNHHDDIFMLWAVLGYKTIAEAYAALYPARLYDLWVTRSTHGTGSIRLNDLVDIDVFMANKNLPLNPAEFEVLLKDRISLHMREIGGSDVGCRIERALRDYEREHAQ